MSHIPTPPILLVTDATQSVLPLEHCVEEALAGGCRWVLLRDLHASEQDFLAQARRMKTLCEKHAAKLFISRHTEIAKAIHADGLHLSSTMNIADARKICGNMTLGKSCHTLADIHAAEKDGADYVTLSPIFASRSKPNYAAIGVESLRTATTITGIPVIALGGISAQQIKTCMSAGAKGVAIMGDIMRSASPRDAFSACHTMLNMH